MTSPGECGILLARHHGTVARSRSFPESFGKYPDAPAKTASKATFSSVEAVRIRTCVVGQGVFDFPAGFDAIF